MTSFFECGMCGERFTEETETELVRKVMDHAWEEHETRLPKDKISRQVG